MPVVSFTPRTTAVYSPGGRVTNSAGSSAQSGGGTVCCGFG
jgi:hypothetical protein